ncbi:hypothetical protein J4E93_007648 [Alternaria ventricosa]|uniref:uncharacterized protein n=1 Tax=Alternaria ventricosa TaxID=1187951 RepID=UPI0020C21C77|nr:uncharacterized protein J4E93_007648 [Alternaria ventricosa]KAI4641551.1 hypothetical protein J4E93_007648 [Alternaria ventricosa]
MPPPYAYHDLLDAAARVGRIEGIMGYKFKDKMICIEALKTTSATTPLYFNGVVHHIDKNNRLALLGDRVLSLALCDVWFKTGNTNAEYTLMQPDIESRVGLGKKGYALGINDNLLLHDRQPSTFNHVAEAFEAVLGAIYLDSGNSIETVKEVVTGIKLDSHKMLEEQITAQDRLDNKRLAALQYSDYMRNQAAYTRKAQLEANEAALAAKEAAKLAEKQVADQPREEAQEDTQIHDGHSGTVQPQTKKKSSVALTHAEASKNLADSVIEYRKNGHPSDAKDLGRLDRKDAQRQSPASKEKPSSQNSNQASDSKLQRRAVVAANKLSKEGYLLNDVLEHDDKKTVSKRPDLPASHVENQDKIVNRGTKLSPEEEADEFVASMKFPAEMESSEGLKSSDKYIMRRAWDRAVQRCYDSIRRGEKRDFEGTFTHRIKKLVHDQVTIGSVSNRSKETRRLLRLQARLRGHIQGEEDEDTHHQVNSKVPIKLSEETTQAPVAMSPEPTAATATKANLASQEIDPIREIVDTGLEKAEPQPKTGMNDDKPARGLSDSSEKSRLADAATTEMDDDKNIQVRTKDVESLERDILNSHNNAWQAADAAETSTSQQRSGRTTRARRSAAEGQTENPSALNEFFESDTDRFMSTITQNDSEASDAPQPKPHEESDMQSSDSTKEPGESSAPLARRTYSQHANRSTRRRSTKRS